MYAVRNTTVILANSDGCICIPPITNHLWTLFITGPIKSTSIKENTVIKYIGNITCQY